MFDRGGSSPGSSNKGKKLTQEEYYRELDSWISDMRKMFGMLRYYLHIEPLELEYWEVANRYRELEWIRKEENKHNG